ncbi:LRR repeats and ubiquitin-like domain-containing protein [Dorcoceras hygrometricum]|uniref:LRR repeats and ubiquitin-like domain-containing protein n=1 Tax=Dorcoceras hygrometricum TaxID=472368 RepID=A0A2Z6ZY17_9LAMI|nr:LRR repeats and ubiquitin-like domain-containing protein [Dorcoceras hygrometricum]
MDATSVIIEQDGPIKKEVVVMPSDRMVADTADRKKEKNGESVKKSQVERWKAIGVIALADCHLTVHTCYFLEWN